jgi:hypothetical protein
MNTQPTYGIARQCNAGLPRVSARPRIASAVTPSDGPTAGRRPWRCWMVAAAVLVGAG